MSAKKKLTDAERLDQIEMLKNRMDADRAQILEHIRDVFPENRGEPMQRGRLTEVVKRARWTREYIAQIRDGKVTE